MRPVFIIDPGTKTGVAWAVVGEKGTVRDRLRGAEVESRTVGLDPIAQAKMIVRLADIARQGYKHLDIVFEDFILGTMTSDRRLLDPVRVTSGVLALITPNAMDRSRLQTVTFQQPSEAMSYATNDRLRHWGLWIKGSDPSLEHQRDARRHLALFIAKQISRESREESRKGRVKSGSRSHLFS